MEVEHDAVQDTVDHEAVALVHQSHAADRDGYEDYGNGYDDFINIGGMAVADTGNRDFDMDPMCGEHSSSVIIKQLNTIGHGGENRWSFLQ